MDRLLLLTLVWACAVDGRTTEFSANEYEYSVRRDWLKAAEARHEGRHLVLTQDELVVSHYLDYLKREEFERTRESGFPPSRPIEEVMDSIMSSEVYRVLKKMPKGGNMHTHEDFQLSRRTLLDIIWDSPDFRYLHILPENHTTDPWRIDFFINPPTEEWIRVEPNQDVYSKDTIYEHHNLMSILDDEAKRYPSDSDKRWALMNTLWETAGSQVLANFNILVRHLEELYKHSFEEGVTYLETRKALGSEEERIYVMDPDPDYESTYGKRYMELDMPGELDVQTTLEAVANFTADHPEFIGHRRIHRTFRRQSFSSMRDAMNITFNLHRKYPKHVVGFDMAGHEDMGNSLLYYIHELLHLYDDDEKRNQLPFSFHTAETTWADDIMSSLNDKDLVSTAENTYDSLLLGTRRMGHGHGLVMHPYLMDMLKKNNIAVEVCPVGNQILGYYPDVRNHPKVTFLRDGGAVVLGSDDAGIYGFDHFTLDWYEVFMAWGLDLVDLKTLALNSLNYSAMNEEEKAEAINNKFLPSWDSYIETIHNEACGRDFSDITPTFARILPRSGANVGMTNVHVFGRHFERAMCHEEMLACRFGEEMSTRAHYISTKEIVCETPDITEPGRPIGPVAVYVTFDGDEFLDTGEQFEYKYDPLTSPPPTESQASSPTNAFDIYFFSINLYLMVNSS